jgi:hypothetical protein
MDDAVDFVLSDDTGDRRGVVAVDGLEWPDSFRSALGCVRWMPATTLS